MTTPFRRCRSLLSLLIFDIKLKKISKSSYKKFLEKRKQEAGKVSNCIVTDCCEFPRSHTRRAAQTAPSTTGPEEAAEL